MMMMGRIEATFFVQNLSILKVEKFPVLGVVIKLANQWRFE